MRGDPKYNNIALFTGQALKFISNFELIKTVKFSCCKLKAEKNLDMKVSYNKYKLVAVRTTRHGDCLANLHFAFWGPYVQFLHLLHG